MKLVRASSVLAGLIAAALVATPAPAQARKIGISTVLEVPQLLETKQGVLEALAERGFVEGKTLTVDYQSANGNMPTQQQIAKKFVGEGLDAIVAITTPTAQAMASATKDVPIVFAAVTDPVKAKLIPGFAPTGGNVTGVSDAAPVAIQLKLFRELVPGLKRLGFVYNPGLDSSSATLGWVKEEGAKLGIEVTEAAAPTTNEVVPAARKLVGKVDAIYVPNDTTVVAALEAVVKIGEETRTPVFTGETRGVDRGALASAGLNYLEVGKLAGRMVADILSGKKAGEIEPVIAYQKLPTFVTVVNKRAADAMGVTIPPAVLARASKVVN